MPGRVIPPILDGIGSRLRMIDTDLLRIRLATRPQALSFGWPRLSLVFKHMHAYGVYGVCNNECILTRAGPKKR